MSRTRTWFRRHVSAVIWLALPLTAAAAAPETVVTAPGAELELAAPAPGLVVEAALDGGVMAPLEEGRITAPDAGAHWLAVRTRNALGAGSPVRWIRLVVDGEAPEMILAVEPAPVEAAGRSWVPRGARVLLRAEDAPAGLARAALEAEGRSRAAEGGRAALVLDREGEVTVTASAEDRVGNRDSRRLTLAVDGTPPRVELVLEGPWVETGRGPVGSATARIRLAAEDGGSGVGGETVRVDGAGVEPGALDGPWAPGEHAVEAEVSDQVGNRAAARLAFLTDVVAPVIRCSASGAAEIGQGESRWYRPPLTVTCSAEDALAGVARIERESGGSWLPVEAAFTLAGGEVAVRAADRVGNERGERFRWPVDGEPPRLELLLEDGTAVPAGGEVALAEGGAVRPRAADDGSGVAEVVYRLGGGAWTGAPSVVRFRHRGSYELRIRACDRLANCTEAAWPVRVSRGGAR